MLSLNVEEEVVVIRNGWTPKNEKKQIILVHKPHSYSSSDRHHWPLYSFQRRFASGLRPLSPPFSILIDDLLVELEDDTYLSAYANDQEIPRCVRTSLSQPYN